MKKIEKYQKILKNFNYIYTTDIRFKYSDIVLFREYQTRLYAWKQELNLNTPDFFNKSKEYHNLLADLFQDWESKVIPFDDIINDLKKLGIPFVDNTLRDFQGFLLSLYVNWEILKKDNTEINNYTYLKHPYFPIYKIILRGGLIQLVHNKFMIDNKIYLRYDNQFSLPSLEDDFLNYIDSNVTDFPNQEKVNQLWENFKSSTLK
jgi:hypothetical protein